MDEAVSALKEKQEREKNLLTEENRKLTADNDKVRPAVAPPRPPRSRDYPPLPCAPLLLSSAPPWTS